MKNTPAYTTQELINLHSDRLTRIERICARYELLLERNRYERDVLIATLEALTRTTVTR